MGSDARTKEGRGSMREGKTVGNVETRGRKIVQHQADQVRMEGCMEETLGAGAEMVFQGTGDSWRG